jgi:hypothetical protein
MILASVPDFASLTADDYRKFSVAQSAIHNIAKEVRAALFASVQTTESASVDFVLHLTIDLLNSFPQLVGNNPQVGDIHSYPL